MKKQTNDKLFRILTILLLCFAILPVALAAAGSASLGLSPEFTLASGILAMIALAVLIAQLRIRHNL